MKYAAAALLLLFSALLAQEASSGIDLGATVTSEAVFSHELTESPRDGPPVAGGFRSLLYPTWKIGGHWDFTGVVQVIPRPFYYESFSTRVTD